MNSAPETRNDTVLLAPTIHQKLTASPSRSQPGQRQLWLSLLKGGYGRQRAAPALKPLFPLHSSSMLCPGSNLERQTKFQWSMLSTTAPPSLVSANSSRAQGCRSLPALEAASTLCCSLINHIQLRGVCVLSPLGLEHPTASLQVSTDPAVSKYHFLM